MTIKNRNRPALTNASALLMSDAGRESALTLLLLQIAGWYTVDASLSKNGRSLKAEWACLRNRLAGRKP